MVRDKETGKSRGYAFICYEDQRSTVLAVDNFNGAKLAGRIMRVDHVRQYRKKKEDESEGKQKDNELSKMLEDAIEEKKKEKKQKKEKKDKKEKKEKKDKDDEDLHAKRENSSSLLDSLSIPESNSNEKKETSRYEKGKSPTRKNETSRSSRSPVGRRSSRSPIRSKPPTTTQGAEQSKSPLRNDKRRRSVSPKERKN